MSSEENCSFLYLQAPAGLSRDESYVYHLTTRNFFAWLLGVPLVGTDPVSALLGLKLRMDMWRDPGSGNFGALFDYVKEQGYGDFEALEIEMGKRLNADMNQANGTVGFPPTNPMIFNDQSRPKDEENTSRRNSITQRIKRKLSRSRVRDEEPPVSTLQGPNNMEARVQTLRMNSYTYSPPPPSADHISAAMQKLVGPPSTHSINTVSDAQNGKEDKMRKRRSWTNIAGNAWKRKSMTDVRLPPLQTQQPQPVGLSANEGPYTSAPVFAQQPPLGQTSAVAEKKKRRLSWKRASMTDIKLPPPQTQQAHPANSSAIHRPPSAAAPASGLSPHSTPKSASVSAEEKKKRRLSWANVSDKIFDIMMPPMSKDDVPPPGSQLQEGNPSATSKQSELPATEIAAGSPSSPLAAVAVPATEAKPVASTSAGGSATRSSSRHPSIHDFSTGKEICACCGKVRQLHPQSGAGPAQPPQTEAKDAINVKENRGAFGSLHDHMKNRRNKFKSRPHKEIIVPDYGNGIRGQAIDSGKGKNRATDPVISDVEVRPGRRGRNTDARKMKTRSIDAVVSPVEVRGADAGRAKTLSVSKTLPVDAIVAPGEARTEELKKLNAKPNSGVFPPVKVQHETSSAVPAGPMLAAELVGSPTRIPELSASPSSPESLSLRDYRRSSRPASMDNGQRVGVGVGSGVVKLESGRGGVNDINDVHYRVTTAREPRTGPLYGSGRAMPVTENLSQEPRLEEEKFRVVDADFESNIEDLLAQLEAAGISETRTEKGKDKQKSLVDLEPRVGMPRLVFEVA